MNYLGEIVSYLMVLITDTEDDFYNLGLWLGLLVTDMSFRDLMGSSFGGDYCP